MSNTVLATLWHYGYNMIIGFCKKFNHNLCLVSVLVPLCGMFKEGSSSARNVNLVCCSIVRQEHLDDLPPNSTDTLLVHCLGSSLSFFFARLSPFPPPFAFLLIEFRSVKSIPFFDPSAPSPCTVGGREAVDAFTYQHNNDVTKWMHHWWRLYVHAHHSHLLKMHGCTVLCRTVRTSFETRYTYIPAAK